MPRLVGLSVPAGSWVGISFKLHVHPPRFGSWSPFGHHQCFPPHAALVPSKDGGHRSSVLTSPMGKLRQRETSLRSRPHGVWTACQSIPPSQTPVGTSGRGPGLPRVDEAAPGGLGPGGQAGGPGTLSPVFRSLPRAAPRSPRPPSSAQRGHSSRRRPWPGRSAAPPRPPRKWPPASARRPPAPSTTPRPRWVLAGKGPFPNGCKRRTRLAGEETGPVPGYQLPPMHSAVHGQGGRGATRGCWG